MTIEQLDEIDYLRDQLQQENDDEDSDEELQIAFQKGLLQKGITVEYRKKPRSIINNVEGLKAKLEQFKWDLPWVECLQLTVEPAPIAPEMAIKMDTLKNKPDLSDDFTREMYFYRLAQSAVLEGIPRLKSLGIITKRPDDYFAQMSKTDRHMQKVRTVLTKKQTAIINSERAKKMRELKKFGKKVEIEVKLKRQKEKKELLDNIKKFRKGKADSLGFLDDPFETFDSEGVPKSKRQIKKEKEELRQRKQWKDKKYGFGGKKKHLKRVKPADIDNSFNKKRVNNTKPNSFLHKRNMNKKHRNRGKRK